MAAKNAARQSPTFSGYRIFSRSRITCSTRFRSASNSSGVLVGGTWINGKIVRSTLENGFGIANPSQDFSLQKELNSNTNGINAAWQSSYNTTPPRESFYPDPRHPTTVL